jgi:DNA transformation protein and related proteins
MAASKAFVEFLHDQLRSVGPIAVRRMFSGAGIYAEGVMFALIADDTLYLKADEATRAAFEAEGLEAFTYATKNGRNTLTSFWRAPERLFDDVDEMRAWARKAIAVARRAAKAGRKKARKKAAT